ncbi:WD repeat-containing protein 78 [Chytriomyces hyalinus]|nr:WD repeat-containing protein 78 [Chytriomyces hyalinus]
MESSTNILPKRGAANVNRRKSAFLGAAMAAQMSSSAHFDASALRSKNALQIQGGAAASQRIAMGGASKANFSMVGHSSAAVNSKSMAGVMDRVAPTPAATVTVLDEEGNDVTPISLIQNKSAHYKHPMMQGVDMFASTMKESVSDVLNDLESMNMASWNSSSFGGRRSVSNSSRASDISDNEDDSASAASSEDSGERVHQTIQHSENMGSTDGLSKNKADAAHEGTKMVHIRLTETETVVLINLPSLAVCSDFLEDLATVKANNARYSQLCITKANNENYVDHGMQTINATKKNKDVQASGPTYTSSECQVTQWGIYDALNQSGLANLRHDDHHEAQLGTEDRAANSSHSTTAMSNQNALSQMLAASESIAGMRSNFAVSSVVGNSMSVDGSESDRFSVVGTGAGGVGNESESVMDRLIDGGEREAAMLACLNQDNLKASLLIMERAVVGNNYESKLMMYRNIVKPDPAAMASSKLTRNPEFGGEEFEDDGEEEEEMEEEVYGSNIPTLTILWSYRCDLTRGRSVAYMSWNKENEDILAVAYGENKHSSSPSLGLILCWSLKNPEWPERIYRSSQPVTALDFSKFTPNLLAAGFLDGKIAIYDVRQASDVPVLDNNNIAGKHRDPIWELKWIEREQGLGDDHSKGESLISISTDGRVCQWQIRKGFEHTDLMVLKRVTKKNPDQQTSAGGATAGHSPARQGSGGGGESGGSHAKPAAFISRQAGGLCFDFNPTDRNIYLLGTEDGHIHRCSISYNEQYLQTQFGHTGPVYKVKWSPFLPNVFLSCSSDWTVRLWDVEDDSAIFKFQSGKNAITDIAWSPTNSTIFSCVSCDGRLEVWDLKHSVLDPVVVHTVLDRQLTSILFGSKSPCILVGDDSGSVSVFTLKKPSFKKGDVDTGGEDQAAILENVLRTRGVDSASK